MYFVDSFYGPYEYSRLDGLALEIQRDRDHGIPDVNTVLKSYGLPVVNTWGDLGPTAQVYIFFVIDK